MEDRHFSFVVFLHVQTIPQGNPDSLHVPHIFIAIPLTLRQSLHRVGDMALPP